MTSFENQCYILSDLWLNYRYDEEFKDFIEYNDLGLPLAYAVSEKIVEKTKEAQVMIEESFSLLLAAVETDDTGFDSLDDILALR
jgi:hypothetical protein